jgi:hypothetical protein
MCLCILSYIYSIEKKRKSDSHKFGLVGGPISTKQLLCAGWIGIISLDN